MPLCIFRCGHITGEDWQTVCWECETVVIRSHLADFASHSMASFLMQTGAVPLYCKLTPMCLGQRAFCETMDAKDACAVRKLLGELLGNLPFSPVPRV
jgi:hypothetical protein